MIQGATEDFSLPRVFVSEIFHTEPDEYTHIEPFGRAVV